MRYLSLLAGFIGMLLLGLAAACTSTSAQYISPMPGAKFVSTGTTIAIRYGPTLNKDILSSVQFTAEGSLSGPHEGKTILADDQKTIIFTPDQPFTPGETVKAKIGIVTPTNDPVEKPYSFSFTIGVDQKSGAPGQSQSGDAASKPAMKVAFPDDLTLPQDIPHYTVTSTPDETGDGYIFVAPYEWVHPDEGSYLLILDNQGQIVYYKSVQDDISTYDFKLQPNGMLSYYSQADSTFYLMDSHYQVVDSFQAGNGYEADLHDFQLLPNGNALLLVADSQTVDMSQYVAGGKTNATVIGTVIQELDPDKNVIFEWRSWDHIPFTDSGTALTGDTVDYDHGNALSVDTDGNILLSSRNLSEITKINLQTGEIMWRLGGKANQFTFANDVPFGHQHDVTVIGDGEITVFDNLDHPGASRGVEYKLDVNQKTATKVWEFSHDPPVFATYMGDTQRLPNGNTLMDWGAPSTDTGFSYANITEVTPDNQTVFELAFDEPFVSYRAFRFPWQGDPLTPPDLAYKEDNGTLTLGYSWNGATDVAGYEVLGGESADALTQLEQKDKAGFETQSQFSDLPAAECYFQVVPVDKNGKEMTPSQVISTDAVKCPLSS